LPIKVVGIRPGEKLHEVMCPLDDSHRTIEFADHYVIIPSIEIEGFSNQYETNARGETGQMVHPEFEYNSGSNHDFLTVEQIRTVNSAIAHP
jgi:UDP-N-acetylglucosamine 4,6-dehydratase